MLSTDDRMSSVHPCVFDIIRSLGSSRHHDDDSTDRDKAWLASAPDSDERCNLENELVKYTKGKATRVMIRQNAQKLLASKA